MPAVSEPALPPDTAPSLPRTWRPLGVRLAGWVFGGLLLLVCTMVWLTFDPEVRAGITWPQRGTLIGFGVMAAYAMNALMRSRVIATEPGLEIVNGYRRRRFTWAEVVAVSMPNGAPWATLDLANGTTVPVMGIQSSDGDRARSAMREIRTFLDR